MYLHTLIPFAFFLILLGVYFVDFSKIKIIQIISYYSYNWYLWHAVFVLFISDWLSTNMAGILVYLVITFCMAVLTTICIEEPILEKRKKIIAQISN